MWFVYILYSAKIDRYYIGTTEDLQWRLERHNNGWGKYTKRGIPWTIVYFEQFKNKSDAFKREREIKNKKSKKYIEDIIKKYNYPRRKLSREIGKSRPDRLKKSLNINWGFLFLR
jgi:putative endonuclease